MSKPRPNQIIPPLQVVTGKGGVGKSTFAAALALKVAKTGRQVLAIEMGTPGGVAGLLGVRPEEHGVPVHVSGGLWLAYFDGEASLAEYILRFMPFKSLMKGFFHHPLYRAFVNAGPGVRELMAIGKVRDELLGLSTGKPRWDLIVLDAGASGHALQLLRMPAATAKTFSSGLAHREATKVSGALADPTQTAVHVVALPEEMPLEEAAEIVEQLRGTVNLPLGRLVVNQCRPIPPAGVSAALSALEQSPDQNPTLRAMELAGRRAAGWTSLQEQGIAALEARVGVKVQRLPVLASESFGRHELETLAASISEVVPS